MSIKCKNPGCGQSFDEDNNGADVCCYHSSGPSFRDGNKVWPCCNKSHWDWDGFLKIEGCTRGSHSANTKPKPVETASASDPVPVPVPVAKPIPAEPAPEVKKADVPMKPQILPSGNFRCAHPGCGKEYSDSDNSETACEYHLGQPTFRDQQKAWTCCGAKSHDWDDFMKLPRCAKGKHEPKMVPA